jgi:hypothetical protein
MQIIQRDRQADDRRTPGDGVAAAARSDVDVGMANAEEVSRNAGQAAERVVGAVLRLPGDVPAVSAKMATAGRAVLDAMRDPDQLADRAKKLQKAAPMLRQAASPLLTGRVDWTAEYAYTAGSSTGSPTSTTPRSGTTG